MSILWHYLPIGSGPKANPRRTDPRVFADDRPDAGGWPEVATSNLPMLATRARELTALVGQAARDGQSRPGVELGLLVWNPGGVNEAPTAAKPFHCEYPDRPFADARAGGMAKLGNAAAFELFLRRAREVGVTQVCAYIGRPRSPEPCPELLGMVRRGLITHVAFDGTAHCPATLDGREAQMRAYEKAGAIVGYEAIPNYDGPGSDLWRNPDRICFTGVTGWKEVVDKETALGWHPNRNVPPALLPRACVCEFHLTTNQTPPVTLDPKVVFPEHVQAGRDVAVNFHAPWWKDEPLTTLVGRVKSAFAPVTSAGIGDS